MDETLDAERPLPDDNASGIGRYSLSGEML
jgi:hypothetical protein